MRVSGCEQERVRLCGGEALPRHHTCLPGLTGCPCYSSTLSDHCTLCKLRHAASSLHLSLFEPSSVHAPPRFTRAWTIGVVTQNGSYGSRGGGDGRQVAAGWFGRRQVGFAFPRRFCCSRRQCFAALSSRYCLVCLADKAQHFSKWLGRTSTFFPPRLLPGPVRHSLQHATGLNSRAQSFTPFQQLPAVVSLPPLPAFSFSSHLASPVVPRSACQIVASQGGYIKDPSLPHASTSPSVNSVSPFAKSHTLPRRLDLVNHDLFLFFAPTPSRRAQAATSRLT